MQVSPKKRDFIEEKQDIRCEFYYPPSVVVRLYTVIHIFTVCMNKFQQYKTRIIITQAIHQFMLGCHIEELIKGLKKGTRPDALQPV